VGHNAPKGLRRDYCIVTSAQGGSVYVIPATITESVEPARGTGERGERVTVRSRPRDHTAGPPPFLTLSYCPTLVAPVRAEP